MIDEVVVSRTQGRGGIVVLFVLAGLSCVLAVGSAEVGWAVFALILSLSWVVPWYVMWLLPLAALSASCSLKRATLAVTVLLFLTSLPATALFLADEVGWYPDHTKLGKHHAQEIQRYLK